MTRRVLVSTTPSEWSWDLINAVHNPQQFIRQWRKFSQGLADRQIDMCEPVFHYREQDWHGLPFDPRRSYDQYIQPGDTVLCWGRVCTQLTFVRDHCRYISRAQLIERGPAECLARQRDYRALSAGRIAQVMNVRPAQIGRLYVAGLSTGHTVFTTGLSLPIEMHFQRQAELEARGYTMYPGWVEVKYRDYLV